MTKHMILDSLLQGGVQGPPEDFGIGVKPEVRSVTTAEKLRTRTVKDLAAMARRGRLPGGT